MSTPRTARCCASNATTDRQHDEGRAAVRPAPWREQPSGRVAADLLLQLGVEAAYFGVDARIPRLRTTGSERHHADQRGTDHQRSAGVTLAGILPALGITRAHHAVGHEELAVGSPAVLVG